MEGTSTRNAATANGPTLTAGSRAGVDVGKDSGWHAGMGGDVEHTPPDTGQTEPQQRAAAGVPTTLRWFVSAGALPPVTAALWVGERLQEAVLGTVCRAVGHVPDALDCHGDGRLPQGHPHPFYLCEDADGDGFIDHLVLHAPRGLSRDWRRALARVRPASAEAGVLPPFAITADWLGWAPARSVPGTLLGSARRWCSATPYVPDVHLKPRFGVAEALARDLRRRGYPEPRKIEAVPALAVDDAWLTAEMFATRRRGGAKPAARSGDQGSFWRLVFDVPVPGPLALGFACHLGLGLFRREGRVLGQPRIERTLPTESDATDRPRKVAEPPESSDTP